MPSLSVLAKAAILANENPQASALLLNLDTAETAVEVIEALEQYDNYQTED